MTESDEDARRMLAFRAGDLSAFDALYHRWGGPLLRFLERMVHDRATAEELVQETFLRVYGARERYRAEARFSTWLYRIATNAALNELRRPHRSRPHESVDHAPRLELLSSGPEMDDVVDARRRSSQVDSALQDLPERQRAALWLSAVEGHSYAEIARTLDTSPQSVKALVHRARVSLAARLEANAAKRVGE